MALPLPLRYLVRRALQQRALVPRRVPPSAGSRREGLRTNESKAAAASKGNTEPELLGSQKLDKVGFASIYKAPNKEGGAEFCMNWMFVMGYAALGAGFAFLCDRYDARNEETITWEVDIK